MYLKRDHGLSAQKADVVEGLIQHLSCGLNEDYINPEELTNNIISQASEGMSTDEFYKLMAETCAYKATVHPDHSLLAGRIAVSRLHDQTLDSFVETMSKLQSYRDERNGQLTPLISQSLYNFALENREAIERAIDFERDYSYDYFGFKTLERSYLLRVNGQIVERPQHMLMRVSIGIHPGDLKSAIKTYNLMSEKWFTHASPTLFNAGTNKPQMSSCFLLNMQEDSIDGIYETLKQCALISQSAGGIGLSIHDIRAKGSFIKGTNGYSNGIVPMLRVFNDTARYVDQGGGKRKGAFAVYLEPWHADVEDFLELKKNHGKEELRARDLFYALWVNDLFMKRVEADEEWSLFCPQTAPNLSETYGERFEELYVKYEKQGRAKKTIKARELWMQILKSQIETGSPFMLYKDAANEKSNQKNLGTIKSSNLCTEIIQYTSKDEIAVCNLASIALPKFVINETFDFRALYDVAYQITINLNKIIDLNYYPLEQARNSNHKHRPIGMGVQGLADTFMKLKMPFESEEAKELNQKIFETIYYAGCKASNKLSKEFGTYDSYQGSPMSEGKFQFDLWGKTPSKLWDWDSLRKDIMDFGMRNSLLVAPMPTASTSQILGNNEGLEPITSNLYTRRVLSGEFVLLNKHLVNDLIDLGLWNEQMKNQIVYHNGSIQEISEIPESLRDVYKTTWEIKQKTILEMAADRGAFIDQSQSLNIFFAEPNVGKLSAMHMHAWKLGLKTGMYYLRSKPAAQSIKFTLDKEKVEQKFTAEETMVCSLTNPEECIACGS